jgi:hypothetical protein
MTEAQANVIGKRLASETEARAALQSRLDGLAGPTGSPAASGSGSGALPLLAVVCVAVLASAVTAFLMIRLARPGPVATAGGDTAPAGLITR